MENFNLNYEDIAGLLPFIAFVFALSSAMLIMLLSKAEALKAIFAPLSCLVAIPFVMLQVPFVGETVLSGLIRIDYFSILFNIIILLSTFFCLLLQNKQLDKQGVDGGTDIDLLVCFAALGGMVMVASTNLMLMFIGFELLSISVYVLATVARKEKASAEAGLKYFILGAFSSAFLLFGIVLIYGASGSMELAEIAKKVVAFDVMFLVGMGMILFGLGFKVSIFPFHFWAPDVYQGSPTSITAFMASAVKVAAFAVMLRVFFVAFEGMTQVWTEVFWTLSILTMSFGNLVALRQQSIKRMLAYSSIAHAGYMLIGFVAADNGGGGAVIYYSMIYAVMTIASFGIVLLVSAGTKWQYENDDIISLSNAGWKNPLLGIVMSLAMLSLAGMPPLAGFFAKFYLFGAALESGFIGLIIVAALNSVLSLYYYLRVIVVMYFSDSDKNIEPLQISTSGKFALVCLGSGIIILGLFPSTLLQWAGLAIESLH